MSERICVHCDSPLEPSHQFCRVCGRATGGDGQEAEQHIVMDLPPPAPTGFVLTRKLPVSRTVAYIIAIFIILVLLAIAIPDVRHTHGRQPPERRCRTWMRVLEGAIDMWEMDTAGNLFPGGILVHSDGTPSSSGAVLAPDYVKKISGCPSRGEYHWDSTNHEVSCTKHGTVDNPTVQ